MKSLSYLAFLCIFMKLGHASIEQAPPSFAYLDSKVVFVDFQTAQYNIVYDIPSGIASVESIITFDAPEFGYPMIDLIANPSEIMIDGIPSESQVIQDPDKATSMRVLQQTIMPGSHRLAIKHRLTHNVEFKDGKVASGFWTSDLSDRKYLEQYLPANLEYDQVQMSMLVKVIGGNEYYALKTNGEKRIVGENAFEVKFPSFYTASSVFFHLLPEANLGKTTEFDFISIDGRKIPVDIYTIYDPAVFASETVKILTELEKDYGPFPHDQLVIYGNMASGGMEYSGATATSLSALGHELFHSYHARSLMPANGNAGWMDEAIARWRDNKYPLKTKVDYERTQLAGRSVWMRMTDRMAYTEGSAFLAWIAHRMNEKGQDFKVFLKEYFDKFKFTTVTTELFRDELYESSGLSIYDDFEKYIYGRAPTILARNSTLCGNYVANCAQNSKKTTVLKQVVKEDPFHPTLTAKELKNLTWGTR